MGRRQALTCQPRSDEARAFQDRTVDVAHRDREPADPHHERRPGCGVQVWRASEHVAAHLVPTRKCAFAAARLRLRRPARQSAARGRRVAAARPSFSGSIQGRAGPIHSHAEVAAREAGRFQLALQDGEGHELLPQAAVGATSASAYEAGGCRFKSCHLALENAVFAPGPTQGRDRARQSSAWLSAPR